MGVIIGAATTVSFGSEYVTQISWNINPNVQRAYVLGDWTPYTDAEVKSPTETLNLTIYSPGGTTYDVSPTTSCEDANTVTVSVSPTGCGDATDGPDSTSWYVTGYNYSKGDARAPGQESWAMMQYVDLDDDDVTLPTYVLRGISTGTITAPDSLASTLMGKVGIEMDTDTADTGTTGSVSAGQLGRSDYAYEGVISQIGGSSAGSGDIMNGSVSIPYTPLYI